MRHPAKAPPWISLRLGHLSQECCPWSPGLQTVSLFCEVLIVLSYSLCSDNRIFPRLHLGCWMHYSRPPSYLRFAQWWRQPRFPLSDPPSYLYKRQDNSQGMSFLTFRSTWNFISKLQVTERSTASAILSGARWTRKTEKWGYGRWDTYFDIKLDWVPECPEWR